MTNSTVKEKTRYALKKLRRLHILLVEDNLLNAKLVAVLFVQYGIKLDWAENGMIAIEKIKTTDFDLVLMDMQMPVINGYQATTMIRQQLKNNVPIIALTAHESQSEREKCLQLGMNDYIPKPINAKFLLRSVYNLACCKTASITKGIKKFPAPALPADKICNMGYLLGITRGNKKIMNNIVSVFFKETSKELIFLNNAIEKTNYTVISDISHKIKSSFSILGISVLEPVFKEMEQLSNRTSPIEKIEQLNRRVNMVFDQARAEMKSEN